MSMTKFERHIIKISVMILYTNCNVMLTNTINIPERLINTYKKQCDFTHGFKK